VVRLLLKNIPGLLGASLSGGDRITFLDAVLYVNNVIFNKL
jgi:hypothetical protein